MIILTNKKMKRLKTEMYVVAGTGVVTGLTGVTIATISVSKEKKFEKEANAKIENIEKHVASVEQSVTKCCKALVPIQQTMLDHGMIKMK